MRWLASAGQTAIAHKRRFVWAGALAVTFLSIFAVVSVFVTPYEKQNIQSSEFYVTNNAADPTTLRATVIEAEGTAATVRIEEGPRRDDRVAITVPKQVEPQPGDRMLLNVFPDGSLSEYSMTFWRIPGLVGLALLFVLIVFMVSGRRGLASLAGLAITIAVIGFGLVPAVLAGTNAFTASVLAAYAIGTLAIVTAHGLRWRTIISLLSIFAILTLAVLLALLGEYLGSLTGVYDETSALLQIRDATIDMRGILVGGIIIATLGVLDDVITTQTATVEEIHKAQPTLTVWSLFKRGMSVGNEHVIALVNTLALAYVGVSLPMILSLVANSGDNTSLLMLINSEFIAQEIVRTLVSGMALIAAVPIATVVAAGMVRYKRRIFAIIVTKHTKRRT